MSKTILITGSTDGIGKLAALQLAQAGHTVHVHGRNPAKVSALVDELHGLSSASEQSIGFVSDFSDMAAVRRMGEEVAKQLPKLNVLINNAGVLSSPNIMTVDGFDIRFAVNYFAPYLLTHAVLPLLKATHQARIINLSSAAQMTISDEALAGRKIFVDDLPAYAQSKLALTMWSFALAKQHSDLNVIVVNPGSKLNTRMVQEAFGQHSSPASKGSDILQALATDEAYLKASGQYFDNDKGDFSQAHADAYRDDLIEALMQQTKQLLVHSL